MATLYVDADACPVKDEALKVAARHQVAIFYVSNGGLRPIRHPLATMVTVADSADAADIWIAERIGAGDICITSDVPLAAKCVAAGAIVLKPNGQSLTSANVGAALGMRDLMSDLRAADPLGPARGPKPFSRADRSNFLSALETAVRARSRTAR